MYDTVATPLASVLDVPELREAPLLFEIKENWTSVPATASPSASVTVAEMVPCVLIPMAPGIADTVRLAGSPEIKLILIVCRNSPTSAVTVATPVVVLDVS